MAQSSVNIRQRTTENPFCLFHWIWRFCDLFSRVWVRFFGMMMMIFLLINENDRFCYMTVVFQTVGFQTVIFWAFRTCANISFCPILTGLTVVRYDSQIEKMTAWFVYIVCSAGNTFRFCSSNDWWRLFYWSAVVFDILTSLLILLNKLHCWWLVFVRTNVRKVQS